VTLVSVRAPQKTPKAAELLMARRLHNDSRTNVFSRPHTDNFWPIGAAATAVIAVVVLAIGVPAGAQSASGSDVKSAFLSNFAKFVEWPSGKLPEGQPLVIGVIGDDFVAMALKDLAQGKSILGHAYAIKRLSGKDDLAGLHMLFIGSAAGARVGELLERVGTDGVLTVSDVNRFCALGGMIQFRTESDRVRFDINLQSATTAGLSINSKLLALAGIVNPTKAH
jgi:hypothetical protein